MPLKLSYSHIDETIKNELVTIANECNKAVYFANEKYTKYKETHDYIYFYSDFISNKEIKDLKLSITNRVSHNAIGSWYGTPKNKYKKNSISLDKYRYILNTDVSIPGFNIELVIKNIIENDKKYTITILLNDEDDMFDYFLSCSTLKYVFILTDTEEIKFSFTM